MFRYYASITMIILIYLYIFFIFGTKLSPPAVSVLNSLKITCQSNSMLWAQWDTNGSLLGFPVDQDLNFCRFFLSFGHSVCMLPLLMETTFSKMYSTPTKKIYQMLFTI